MGAAGEENISTNHGVTISSSFPVLADMQNGSCHGPREVKTPHNPSQAGAALVAGGGGTIILSTGGVASGAATIAVNGSVTVRYLFYIILNTVSSHLRLCGSGGGLTHNMTLRQVLHCSCPGCVKTSLPVFCRHRNVSIGLGEIELNEATGTGMLHQLYENE